MTNEVACARPAAEAEAHSWVQEKSLDHWLRRFRCAAGLHSLLMEEEAEAGLVLGPAAGREGTGVDGDVEHAAPPPPPPPSMAAMDDGLLATTRNEGGGGK